MKIHHKCPDCDYGSYEFASVAMHFMRCHHIPKSSASAKVRKLRAEVAMLKHTIRNLKWKSMVLRLRIKRKARK